MARKTRKSTKNLLENGAAITGGLLVGAWGVPKVVSLVNPTGTLDTKIVNIGTAVIGVIAAMNTKGLVQMGSLGLAAGGAAAAVSEMAGLGYVINPNTNLENIVGYGNVPDSRWNAGEM